MRRRRSRARTVAPRDADASTAAFCRHSSSRESNFPSRRERRASPDMLGALASAASRWRAIASAIAFVVAFRATSADGDGTIDLQKFIRRRKNRARWRARRRPEARASDAVDEDADASARDARARAAGGKRGTRRRMSANFVLGVVSAPYEDGGEDDQFAGKALMIVHGKPAFARAAESMKRCARLDRVVVATDDYRIVETAKEYGIETVLVARDARRTASTYARQAAKLTGGGWDFVVALKVDECLIDADSVDACVMEMEANADEWCVASTCVAATDPARLESETRPRCVFDKQGFALYLTRAVIPAIGSKPRETMTGELDLTQRETKNRLDAAAMHWHVLGCSCYDAMYLRTLVDDSNDTTPLQRMENIEALNTLENGYKIKVCPVNNQTPALRAPEDVAVLEEVLRARVVQNAASAVKKKRASPKSALPRHVKRDKSRAARVRAEPSASEVSDAPSPSAGSPSATDDVPSPRAGDRTAAS